MADDEYQPTPQPAPQPLTTLEVALAAIRRERILVQENLRREAILVQENLSRENILRQEITELRQVIEGLLGQSGLAACASSCSPSSSSSSSAPAQCGSCDTLRQELADAQAKLKEMEKVEVCEGKEGAEGGEGEGVDGYQATRCRALYYTHLTQNEEARTRSQHFPVGPADRRQLTGRMTMGAHNPNGVYGFNYVDFYTNMVWPGPINAWTGEYVFTVSKGYALDNFAHSPAVLAAVNPPLVPNIQEAQHKVYRNAMHARFIAGEPMTMRSTKYFRSTSWLRPAVSRCRGYRSCRGHRRGSSVQTGMNSIGGRAQRLSMVRLRRFPFFAMHSITRTGTSTAISWTTANPFLEGKVCLTTS